MEKVRQEEIKTNIKKKIKLALIDNDISQAAIAQKINMPEYKLSEFFRIVDQSI